MRGEFHLNTGIVGETPCAGSEEFVLHELFAGAIGSCKNPQSHRHVGIPTAEETSEMIILASRLLRSVEARAAAAAPDGTP